VTCTGFVQGQEGAGMLPIDGSIPDMTATTDLYLQLQRTFRSQADKHCAAVLQHTQDILAECGHDRSAVQPDDVKLFCQNARNLQVVRFQGISAEASAVRADGLRQVCTTPLSCCIVLSAV
jgi:NEDD8-activating enzyme E1 regulatory subunit